jgi:hypothetical protein
MANIYPRNWLCKVNIYRRPGELYLTRYVIFRCQWFSLYIHKFHISDYPVPHDHPWWWFAMPIKGGYWENFADGTFKWRGPFRPAIRAPREFHWIDLPSDGRSVWTFFATGPRVRRWGFLTEDRGWVDADDYEAETLGKM